MSAGTWTERIHDGLAAVGVRVAVRRSGRDGGIEFALDPAVAEALARRLAAADRLSATVDNAIPLGRHRDEIRAAATEYREAAS